MNLYSLFAFFDYRFQHPSITSLDLEELEKILFENNETGTREDFEKAFGIDKPLSYFIRNIVGLDRNAAKESFEDLEGNV